MVLLSGAARRRVVTPSLPLDARRSLVVTDQAILDGFSFERVMNAVVGRSGTRTTAIRLYQQLFDTQNAKPGLVAPDAAHCDDYIVDGKPGFNGLPRRCPTDEGALATTDPFASGEHIPLGLINRFDLTPVDGSNCGQYRIIFAKRSNSAFRRLHFIFEAVLPNPTPSEGIEGCRAVAQFWADLSNVNSISERRARLERFFFTGLDGFDPVFDPDHYSAASGGGIRTMHNFDAPLRSHVPDSAAWGRPREAADEGVDVGDGGTDDDSVGAGFEGGGDIGEGGEAARRVEGKPQPCHERIEDEGHRDEPDDGLEHDVGLAGVELLGVAGEDLLDGLVGVVALEVGLLADQLLDLLVGDLEAELVGDRLQHELAQRFNPTSQSRGREPQRRGDDHDLRQRAFDLVVAGATAKSSM